MNILENMLRKLGVSYEQLTQEERDTFNAWRTALNGRRLTDEDVAEFLEHQYRDAVRKVSDPLAKHDERTDIFLKMKIDFIINVKEFLDTPRKEKALVEQHIQNTLN